MSACSTTSTGSGATFGPSVSRDSAQSLLSEGRDALESGLAPVAVHRFQEVIARYPESSSAIEARYWLGRSFEELGVVRDAADAYDGYADVAPEGDRKKDAVARSAQLRETFEAQYPSLESIDTRIDALRQQVANDPSNLRVRAELADALWTRGSYEQAAEHYLRLYEAEPSIAQRPEFQRRIELNADGSHVVLTPSELSRREREANPLQVVNFTGFQGIRDTFTQVPRFFIVTGQVVNRGDSVLYGVSITVTIFGFGNTVYDTGTQSLGNMRPGETRAFSMRFRNFRELNSIDRYDYDVSFQR